MRPIDEVIVVLFCKTFSIVFVELGGGVDDVLV